MSTPKKPSEFLPTSTELLRRLKDFDDNKSWQEFVDAYSGLILGVAIKSGLSHSEAEEVVQETLIEVAKRIKDFKYNPSGSFKAWLLQNTRWRIAEQFGERTPGAKGDTRTGDGSKRTKAIERIPNPTGYDLDGQWDSEWREHKQKTALEKVRKKVSAKHYQIFDSLVIKGWPVEQVCRILRVTDHQVFKVKSRIKQMLIKEAERLEQGKV